MYQLNEVNGQDYADEINRLNALFPDDFLPLKPKHFEHGYWWLAHLEHQVVGFCGMVPFDPFPNVGYMKRAAVLAAHRGNRLHQVMMEARLLRAKATTWTHMVSSCHFANTASAKNFIKAGFSLCDAERPWEPESLFWIRPI